MWIDDNTLANMPDTEPTRGRPRQYSDALIQALLGLKAVFHLPLRALQGFAQSLRDLAFAELPVPNYPTVCRRAQTLQVKLPVIHSGEPLHLVVDSTDAKVYGEGEWKVRQHGYSKRRTWRKAHLALDTNTGYVRAALMTHQDVADGEVLPELLDQIPVDEPIDTIGGDCAYDTQACYAAITARSATPSIPPREGAAYWPPTTRRAPAQRRARRHCTGQSTRMEAAKRLPPSFAGRECNVPVQDAHGSVPVGTPNRYASHRSRRSRGRAQPHDRARPPAVRPHRLKS